MVTQDMLPSIQMLQLYVWALAGNEGLCIHKEYSYTLELVSPLSLRFIYSSVETQASAHWFGIDELPTLLALESNNVIG